MSAFEVWGNAGSSAHVKSRSLQSFCLARYDSETQRLGGEMTVEHVPCAPFVNDSERRACAEVKKALEARAGRWIVLTNVAHALTREGRPDEIDMVLVGPDGLIAVEVKHWDRAFIKANQHIVDDEADRLERKAKRLKGRLER